MHVHFHSGGRGLIRRLSELLDMRLKRLENQYRVYLAPDEFRTIVDHAYNRRAEFVLRLGGECGLRVSETLKATLDDVRKANTKGADEAFFLRIPEGKDTSGRLEGGKYRSAWMPSTLLEDILDYTAEADHIQRTDDTIVGASKRTLQKDVTRSAELAAEATGIEEFAHVTSHDLRAYFATNLLVRKNLNPHVVMEIGGWEDWKSIKPYINAQFDDLIIEEVADKLSDI